MVAFKVLVLVKLKQLLKSTSFTLNPPCLQTACFTCQVIVECVHAFIPGLHVKGPCAIYLNHRN